MATIKLLKKAPPFVDSVLATEFIRTGMQMIASDVVNYNDASPVTIFNIPPNSLIRGVVVQIVTAFNGTIPSLAVGVAGAVQRHVAYGEVDVQTTGLYPIVDRPFEYTAATPLIVTVNAGGGGTTGQARIWVYYRPNSDARS